MSSSEKPQPAVYPYVAAPYSTEICLMNARTNEYLEVIRTISAAEIVTINGTDPLRRWKVILVGNDGEQQFCCDDAIDKHNLNLDAESYKKAHRWQKINQLLSFHGFY